MSKDVLKKPNWGLQKPKWNLYDIEDNREHQLFQSVVMEFVDISGIEVDYYQRSDDNPYDTLYGEHTNTSYKTAKKVKILYEIMDEPNLWSSFGMYGGDVITAHLARATWYRDVSSTEEPKIGDAIYVPWYIPEPRTFEVCHVDNDDKAFQLHKFAWILVLRPYRFSEQSESAKELSTSSSPISAYGDNTWIEEQSDVLDAYEDIDTKIYGY